MQNKFLTISRLRVELEQQHTGYLTSETLPKTSGLRGNGTALHASREGASVGASFAFMTSIGSSVL